MRSVINRCESPLQGHIEVRIYRLLLNVCIKFQLLHSLIVDLDFAQSLIGKSELLTSLDHLLDVIQNGVVSTWVSQFTVEALEQTPVQVVECNVDGGARISGLLRLHGLSTGSATALIESTSCNILAPPHNLLIK